MSLIQMRGIVKRFGQYTVIPGLDLDVTAGEFLAVEGQSGSGKSTLMNIIGLLDRPTQGSYLFGGEDMLAADDDQLAQLRSENIGFVFQNFNLIGRISARQNVEMPMVYAGVPRKERTKRSKELLEMVGMADRTEFLPSELSGGQKQRVAIARALANSPELILADEPTGALDSETGHLVMDLFHSLNQEHGKTVVLITHNPELAQECSRQVLMKDGRIS